MVSSRWAQVTAAMRLADGVVLVVDAAEGVMVVTERAIRQALQEGLALTLVISKVREGEGGSRCSEGCAGIKWGQGRAGVRGVRARRTRRRGE
jgi:hypothetical protein